MKAKTRLLHRLRVGVAVVAVVATAAVAAPAESAQATRAQDVTSDAPAPAAQSHVTLADLQKNLRSYHLGPLRASGYGRATLWTLKTNGKYGSNTKLSVGLKYDNFDPRRTLVSEPGDGTAVDGSDTGDGTTTGPLTEGTATDVTNDTAPDGGTFDPDGSEVLPDGTVVPASTFCWPWEDHGPGSACWNDPTTWNWGHIWNNIAGSPKTNIYTSWARMQKCAQGALTGTFGAFGVNAIAGFSIFGKVSGFLALTPGKLVFGVVRGCIFYIFK